MTNISNLNNKRTIFLGTSTLTRWKNPDFETYDYYYKGECFFSSPIRDGFIAGDRTAKKVFSALYK